MSIVEPEDHNFDPQYDFEDENDERYYDFDADRVCSYPCEICGESWEDDEEEEGTDGDSSRVD